MGTASHRPFHHHQEPGDGGGALAGVGELGTRGSDAVDRVNPVLEGVGAVWS